MKNKILALFMVLSLVFVVSCQGGEDTTTVKKGVFVGGTEGITANFEAFGVTEEGVYSIFDEDTFPIDLTLHNKGEYELKVGDVVVTLLGPSKTEFDGISSWELKNTGKIDKLSDLVPTGGEETLTFASDAKYKNKVTTLLDRKWFATIDYHYQTQLILPEVCLKEDLSDKRVCEIGGEKEFFVSGAPLTVTKVEESTAGKGIMALRIKIKKHGSGKITKPGEDFSVNNEKLSYKVDDPLWECKSSGKVDEARLLEGEAEIVCKLKDALAKGILEAKKVSITFDYKYRDTIEETLRIKEGAQ